MKHDVDAITDPYWRGAYTMLVERFKLLEQMLQDRVRDLEKERAYTDQLEQSLQHCRDRFEAIQADYAARLKALGMSDQDIRDFDAYWKAQLKMQIRHDEI